MTSREVAHLLGDGGREGQGHPEAALAGIAQGLAMVVADQQMGSHGRGVNWPQCVGLGVALDAHICCELICTSVGTADPHLWGLALSEKAQNQALASHWRRSRPRWRCHFFVFSFDRRLASWSVVCLIDRHGNPPQTPRQAAGHGQR